MSSNEFNQTVELNVIRVTSGGNAGDGRYFYSFDPARSVTFRKPGELKYVLSDDTPPGIRIAEVVTTYTEGQFSPAEIGKDGRVAIIQNEGSKLIKISIDVIVSDEKAPGQEIICDPQVLNIPD